MKNKAFTTYHLDGIIDISFGLIITIFAIGMITNFNLIGIYGIVVFFIYYALKQNITIPRIGRIKFYSDKKQKKQYRILIMLGLGFFTFFIGMYLFYKGRPDFDFLRMFPTIPIVIIFGLGLIVLGLLNHINRFYFYSCLVVVTAFIGPILKINDAYYTGLPGVIILLSGLYMLIKFIKKYNIIN